MDAKVVVLSLAATSMLLSVASQPAAAAEERVWATATGMFGVRATFIDLGDGKGQLRKADGGVVPIELKRPVEKDRTHVPQVIADQKLTSPVADVAAALRSKKLSVDFVNTPLTVVIEQLATTHQLPIYLDSQWLTKAGIAAGPNISLKARAQPVEAVLKAIVASAALDFSLTAWDAVVVSTADEVRRQGLRCEIYRFLPKADAEQISSQIRRQLAAEPESGPRVELLRLPSVLALVTLHTYAGHRSMEQQFAGKIQRVEVESHTAIRTLGIPQTLVQRTSIEQRDMAIGDLANYLHNSYDLSVALDNRTIAQKKPPGPSSINIVMENQPLGVALDIALNQGGLTWTLDKDGNLVLTTPSGVAQHVRMLTHRFVDLVPNRATRKADLAALMRTIQDFCVPASWSDSKGFAQLSTNSVDRLTVIHTVRGHLEVYRYLNRLRAVGGSAGNRR